MTAPSSQELPVWLITGSSQGIGLSLTRYLLSLSHRVIATSRNPSSTPAVVSEVTSNPNGHWLALDVTSTPEKLTSVLAHALSLYGHIDVLINNAGYCVLGAIEDVPMEKWHQQMDTNFYGPVRVIKELLPHMRARRKGVVVNVSSAQGIIASPGNGVYAASKFALEAVTEALAKEVEEFGIRVVSLELGAFRTGFGQVGADLVLDDESEYAKDGHVVKERLKLIAKLGDLAKGDPEKAARVICEVAMSQEELRDSLDGKRFLRFVFGEDSWMGTSKKIDEMRRTWDAQIEWCKRTTMDVGGE